MIRPLLTGIGISTLCYGFLGGMNNVSDKTPGLLWHPMTFIACFGLCVITTIITKTIQEDLRP